MEAPKKQSFGEVLRLLDDAVRETLVYFDKLDPSDLPTTLKAFLLLRTHKETLDSLSKTIDELYRRYDYEILPEAFETLGFDSVKTAGRNFILSTRVNASIPENLRSAAHKWLTEEAKIPELITERVNPKQLSSFAQSYFYQHGKWPPEELIKIHKQNYIQVRKA